MWPPAAHPVMPLTPPTDLGQLGPQGNSPAGIWKARPSPLVACLLISRCRSLVTISSKTSPSPLMSLVRPVSGSTTFRMTLCRASHSSLVMGFMAWMRDFCSSVSTGPSSSSPAGRCHWSSEGPGSASGGRTSAFSLPFFFSFFLLLFFFFFLFLSLCFPHFFRPWLEEEEDDEEDEELEELEDEEEELERRLLRAWCLLLSSAPEEVVLALRPWDLEAEQLPRASLLLFFLLFSDPRPRERLRLLERWREPTGAIAPRSARCVRNPSPSAPTRTLAPSALRKVPGVARSLLN